MTDHQGEMTPAVWDPGANGGAGGWVRRPTAAGAPRPAGSTPPGPTPPGGAPASPMAAPPQAGAVGDQGPMLSARPYLQADQPPSVPAPPPAPPTVPPTGYGQATPQPGHGQATPQQPGYGQAPPMQPGYGYPPPRAQAHPPTAPLVPPPPGAPGGHGYPPGTPSEAPTALLPPVAAGHPVPAGHSGYPPPPQAPPGGGLDLPGRYEEDPDDEDRPARRRTPLLVGAGLVLLLAVGGGVVLATQHTGSGSPTVKAAAPPTTGAAAPSASGAPASGPPAAGDSPGAGASDSTSASASAGGPNAQSEAQALDALLTQGEAAKAPIGSAVAQVESCPAKADVDAAAQAFSSGADQRDKLVAQLGALNVADIPGGADAVQSLKSAWQTSADIDRAYAAWAQSVSASGCGGSGQAPDTADKQKADQLNPQATQEKKDFVAKWNALAGTYGLAGRTWDRI
ncbi:hypothetical protein LN042_28990 [Kitasatospora sp. RB6PN24]|uniref:hypothetical protein n=1 Tax=Kitasatospora humi TaxID=2893891 RepID=UPI001E63C9DD|nr:hypothetical protein [Kitasatospora humi]MCC9311058.1 hypothetical protein [Kitasatospora humi]